MRCDRFSHNSVTILVSCSVTCSDDWPTLRKSINGLELLDLKGRAVRSLV